MQIALSTHLVVNHRLTTIWLERIWNAGFPLVEVFCARQHLDYQDKAQLSELAYWFRDSELKLHSVHSPMYSDEIWGRSGPQSVINIAHTLKSKRRVAVEEVKRALEIADDIPFRYLVQHLGVSGDEFSEEKMDAAFSSLEEIRLFACASRRRSAAREHAERSGVGAATAVLSRQHASPDELLFRHRPCPYVGKHFK